jgi:hypothetical protein
MRLRSLVRHCAVAGLAASASLPAAAETVIVNLRGYEEVPAVSSPGTGSLRLKIDDRAQLIQYELGYDGLQGNPTMAHIHIGQHGVNGGIAVWLCSTGSAPLPAPQGTPICPSPSGTVTGAITAASVTGISGQLIAAGELGEVVRAIRAGVAYVNVHTSAVGSGEIRGQLK